MRDCFGNKDKVFGKNRKEKFFSENVGKEQNMDFKSSETKDNLMRAFAGESQARNRYTIAAGQAREEKL